MAAPGIARAQARVVVVRAEPATRARGDALALALVASLSAHGRAASLPPRPIAAPGIAGELAAAERAYQTLRLEDAADALSRTIARVDAGEASATRDELLRALLLFALSARASGDEEAARGAIDRALAIDASLALDPAQYPPAMRDLLAERRAASSGSPRAIVELRTDPAGASVEVDGAPSAHRVELALGARVIRGSAPGHRAAGRAFTIEADRTIELSLAPDPAARLADLGPPGAPIEDTAHEAARALGARLLVVDLRLEGARVRLAAIDGERRATIELSESAAVEGAADALVSLLLRPPTTDDATPWIVAGGAAVVLAVVAIVIGVVAGSPSSPASTWEGRGAIRR